MFLPPVRLRKKQMTITHMKGTNLLHHHPFIYQHISEQITKVVSLHGSSFVEASPYLTPKSIITTVSGALYVLFSVSIESSILADLPRFGRLVTFHEKEGDSKGQSYSCYRRTKFGSS